MTITASFSETFFSGSGTSVDVPGRFDVAINGIAFMLDDQHEAFKPGGTATIPLLRSQADQSNEPGESSTNPEDLWPRSQHSWHKGAGQRWLDSEDDSDRARFWNSRGIDPWTRGQIKTLNNTVMLEASANTNLALETAGDYVYMADGTSLKYFADITTATPGVTVARPGVEAATTIKSICSDGTTVYAVVTDGVHTTTAGTGVSAHYSDLTADIIAFTKGRLMAAKDAAIYNITAGGAAPAAHFTHPTPTWKWTCFTEGTACIYFAGYAGDKSVIYSVTIKEDGTGLDVPKVAGELPDGEIVRSMCGYLGYLCIGTDNGRRLATQDTNNYLTIGALNPSDNPILDFEPQDRFVWFSWTNFDADYTGVGRMDLSTLVEDNVPAYASDLMYGSSTPTFGQQGSVTSIVTSHDRRLFTIAGKGLIKETLDGSGLSTIAAFLETSEITYGVPDNKVAMRLAIEHAALVANSYVRAYISVDGGEYALIDTSDDVGSRHPSQPFSLDQETGSVFRLKFVLHCESSTPTALERYTLRAYPVPSRGRVIVVPLLLHEHFEDANGAAASMNVLERKNFIQNLAVAGGLIRYQELDEAFVAFIDETQFQRWEPTVARDTYQGTLACKLKVLGD
jgi:hypothetical protein